MMVLSLLLAVSPTQVGSVSPSAGSPKLTPVACDEGGRPEVKERLSCFMLPVPRDHQKPDAGTYDLKVVIRKALRPEQGAAPVLFLHGGPGAGITRAASRYKFPAEFANGSDTVFFDQRGAGGSQPQPCKDLNRKGDLALASSGNFSATRARYDAAYLSCRARLKSLGIDPSTFGTSVTTADTEWLRQAIGAEQWNIYALSYGTAVALDLMAAHPNRVRAAVLDSSVGPYPRDRNIAGAMYRTLRRIGERCSQDATCQVHHKGSLERLTAAVAQLDKEPIRLRILDGGFPNDEFEINGQELEFMVFGLLAEAPGSAPAVVTAALKRDNTALEKLLASVAREGGATGDVFARTSVDCRDEPQYQQTRKTVRGSNLWVLPFGCSKWSVPGPAPRHPTGTKIPTLLLSGALDTPTPPEASAATARRLGPAATLASFRSKAHAIWPTSDCARSLTSNFFEQPAGPLDLSCMKNDPPLEFAR